MGTPITVTPTTNDSVLGFIPAHPFTGSSFRGGPILTALLDSMFVFGNDLTCERKFNNTANVCYKLLILELFLKKGINIYEETY